MIDAGDSYAAQRTTCLLTLLLLLWVGGVGGGLEGCTSDCEGTNEAEARMAARSEDGVRLGGAAKRAEICLIGRFF